MRFEDTPLGFRSGSIAGFQRRPQCDRRFPARREKWVEICGLTLAGRYRFGKELTVHLVDGGARGQPDGCLLKRVLCVVKEDEQGLVAASHGPVRIGRHYDDGIRVATSENLEGLFLALRRFLDDD